MRGRGVPASGRGGFTLAELLVSAAAGGVVLAGLAALLAAQARSARVQVERARVAEALRVPALVTAAELPWLRESSDLRVLGPGALAVRALRGSAVACGPGPTVPVRYTGLRLPEPEKDSVLLIHGDTETALPLSGVTTGGSACALRDGEQAMTWALPSPVPRGALLLLFESGSYHLANDAFRYRRGAGGRQPLTEELLDTRSGGFRLLDGGVLEVRLVGSLQGPRPGRVPARLRLVLLNTAAERDDGSP